MLNQKQYEFIEQDPCVVDLIRESLANCANDKNLSNLEKFPEPSQEDIKRCQSRVTGHIRLMRANCKYYFTQQEKVLAANNAVLMYIHTTFDVFGRFGNVELKRELKKKCICGCESQREYCGYQCSCDCGKKRIKRMGNWR